MNNIKNLLEIVPIFHCLFLITPILDASVLMVRVTVVQGFAGRTEEDESTIGAATVPPYSIIATYNSSNYFRPPQVASVDCSIE